MTPLEIILLIWAVLATLAAARFQAVAVAVSSLAREINQHWGETLRNYGSALALIDLQQGLMRAAGIRTPEVPAELRKDLMN